MKRARLFWWLLVVTAAMALFAVSAGAEIIDSGTCGKNGDNVTWTLDSDGTLTIQGTGEMKDYIEYEEDDDTYWFDKDRPWKHFEGEIKKIVIENGLKNIGANAFAHCTALISVTIPSSVTSIGLSAFYNCSALTSVTIPNGVTCIEESTFSFCYSLSSVTIPESVITIGKYAFNSCYFTSLALPSSVAYIDQYAFLDCDYLIDVFYNGTEAQWNNISIGLDNEPLTSATIHYNAMLEEFDDSIIDSGACGKDGDNVIWTLDSDGTLTISGEGEMADYIVPSNNHEGGSPWISYDVKKVVIEDGVTNIGNGAFVWSDLTEINIPSSVTSIGEDAFFSCMSLTEITIPSSVKTIKGFAFSCCDYLKSVEIPDGVTAIGPGAFEECASLESVSIPKSVMTIADGAFAIDISLKKITVDSENKYFVVDESGVLYTKDKTTLIQYPCANTGSSFVIPNTVTRLGEYAFAYCSFLSDIIISSNVTNIEKATFAFCESLVSVTFPSSVTSIGESAFAACDNLTDVYYEGTEAQWNNISIGDYNDPLTSATFHFNAVIETPGEPADPSTEPTATASAGTEKETSSSVRNTLLRVLPVLFVLLFSVGLALTVVGQMQINRLKKMK